MKWLLIAVVAMLPVSGLADNAPRREFPKADLLLEPSELAAPDAAERFVILDVRGEEEYGQGHIPGARRIGHDAWKDAFEKEDREAWSQRIGKLGIDPDTPVVVYDDAGMKNAGRIWWILRYWGVDDARLLNGGWRGWKAENLPVSQETPEVKEAKFAAEPKADVLQWLRDPRWQIVDSRSRDEYCGIDKGKNQRGGAIPGAKHLDWVDLINQQTHRFKSPQEIRRLLEQAGIELNRPIATHCQSGGRAAVMAFGLELMGVKDVRNYYRGWSEWGNEEGTPVVVPEPEELIVCGWDEVFILDVRTPIKSPPRKVWSWTAKECPNLPAELIGAFRTTDDCKPVAGGSQILITSSSGGVAVVDRATKRSLFHARVANAHSADVLPGGYVVVASSVHEEGNRLVLYRVGSGERIFEDPLHSAHGAVWDDQRQLLWALGYDQLRAYRLIDGNAEKPSLEKAATYSLPDGGGHDLAPLPGTAELVLSTGKGVFRFDRDRHEFAPYAPIADLGSVKSVNVHPRTGRVAYIQADRPEWWSATIHFLNPKEDLELPGQRLYKARWNPTPQSNP